MIGWGRMLSGYIYASCQFPRNGVYCMADGIVYTQLRRERFMAYGNMLTPKVSVLVSVQDCIVALRKAHTRCAPSLSSLPKVALETVPIFAWLNTDRSRPWRAECRPLPFSFLQAISAVILWPVHVQKVLQASEHLCPAKLQFVVGWLLNIPATCECISGTDLHRQFYVLPH